MFIYIMLIKNISQTKLNIKLMLNYNAFIPKDR